MLVTVIKCPFADQAASSNFVNTKEKYFADHRALKEFKDASIESNSKRFP
jgi:hypothetical protein